MKIKDFVKALSVEDRQNGRITFFFYKSEEEFWRGRYDYRRLRVFDMLEFDMSELLESPYAESEIRSISMNGVCGRLYVNAIMEG